MAQSTIEHEHSIAQHPIVGGWRFENIVETGQSVFISHALFHADGTYVEVEPDGKVMIGVWRATGARTANVTFFAQYPVSPGSNAIVRAEGRLAAELDETGNEMTAPFTFEARKPDGTIDFAGEFIAHGTRLEVAPMVPLETAPAWRPHLVDAVARTVEPRTGEIPGPHGVWRFVIG